MWERPDIPESYDTCALSGVVTMYVSIYDETAMTTVYQTPAATPEGCVGLLPGISGAGNYTVTVRGYNIDGTECWQAVDVSLYVPEGTTTQANIDVPYTCM